MILVGGLEIRTGYEGEELRCTMLDMKGKEINFAHGTLERGDAHSYRNRLILDL